METSKHELILNYCKNKKILNIGATDHPYHLIRGKRGLLMHQKICKVSKECIGTDINKKAIKDLKKIGINNIYYDNILESSIDSSLNNSYDIIVFSDVIEHLSNPGKALIKIYSLCSSNTRVLLTSPNVWSIFTILNHFKKTEKVHKDHMLWLSKKTCNNLIKNSGFEIEKFQFCFYGSNSSKIKSIFKKFILDSKRPVLFYVLKRARKK
mgnify:CR=1 FL=1